eukprot:4051691-Pyramimonas_sp.AAC.1
MHSEAPKPLSREPGRNIQFRSICNPTTTNRLRRWSRRLVLSASKVCESVTPAGTLCLQVWPTPA